MPIFEFVCSECGSRFEKLLRRADETTDCKQCHSDKVTRQLSSFAIGSSPGMKTSSSQDSGPCGCGAPRKGMCSLN